MTSDNLEREREGEGKEKEKGGRKEGMRERSLVSTVPLP